MKLDHGVLAAGSPMPKSCSSQLKRFVELVVLSSTHSETVLPMRWADGATSRTWHVHVCKTGGSQPRAGRRLTMASLLLVAVVRVNTATCVTMLDFGFCRWSRHTFLGMRRLGGHAGW